MSVGSRIEADYLIETALDPHEAAEAMAGEQSSGTIVPVPGETPELKARAAARVEALEPVSMIELGRFAQVRSTPTATAGASCRATRRSAGRISRGRKSGAWQGQTTCTSTGSPINSQRTMTA